MQRCEGTRLVCPNCDRRLIVCQIKDVELRLVRDRQGNRKPRLTPAAASAPDVLAAHAVLARNAAQTLDAKCDIKENPFLGDVEAIAQADVQLDRVTTYLREVHAFCFYCADRYRSHFDMERRCGPMHYRAPPLPAGKEDHRMSYSYFAH